MQIGNLGLEKEPSLDYSVGNIGKAFLFIDGTPVQNMDSKMFEHTCYKVV